MDKTLALLYPFNYESKCPSAEGPFITMNYFKLKTFLLHSSIVKGRATSGGFILTSYKGKWPK